MSQRKNQRRYRLPYGTYSEVARRLEERTGKRVSVQNVWERINRYDDPLYLDIAAEIVAEKNDRRTESRRRLRNVSKQ